MPHRPEPLAGVADPHQVARQHQVGVGLGLRAAHPAPQLVQVGEAEAVGAVDDDGVGVGDIEAALDDGGGEEDVGLAGDEAPHHVLQLLLVHLAVADLDGRLRDQFLQPRRHPLDAHHPVVEEIDLPVAGQLALDGAADHPLVVGADDGLDRLAAGRRRLDRAHVARAGHRQIEGARDRRRREGEDVDQAEELLELLLLDHAEALLLVDHHQPEVFEDDILREQPMGPHHHVDAAVGDPRQHPLLLLGLAVTAEQLDLHRIIGVALAEVLEMLLGQHRGRHQEGGLLAPHHRLEDGADRHLGLAEADVAADQPVHRAGRLHIALALDDRLELVLGLVVDKGLLELGLPRRVGPVGVALKGVPLRLDAEQLGRVIADRLVRLGLRLVPARSAQLVERGRPLGRAEVAGDEVGVFQRDVELGLAGEAEHQRLGLAVARLVGTGERLQPHVAGDPVMKVDHIIALRPIGEGRPVPARSQREEPLLLAQRPERLITAEDFGVAEDDPLGGGPDEAAQQPPLDESNLLQVDLLLLEDFAEPLLLALVVGGDRDLPLLLDPAAQMIEEQLPPPLLHDPIPGAGVEEIMTEKLQLDGRDVLDRRLLAGGIGQLEENRPGGEIFPQSGAAQIDGPLADRNDQADLGLLDDPNRALRRRIEFAERDHLVAVPLAPHRQRRGPGEDIDDAPPDAELPVALHLGLLLVADGNQRRQPRLARLGPADRNQGVFLGQLLGQRQRLLQALPRRQNERRMGGIGLLDPPRNRKPLRRHILIGQGIGDGGLGLGQEENLPLRVPSLQIAGEFLLPLHPRRDHQRGMIRPLQQPRDNKGLRRRRNRRQRIAMPRLELFPPSRELPMLEPRQRIGSRGFIGRGVDLEHIKIIAENDDSSAPEGGCATFKDVAAAAKVKERVSLRGDNPSPHVPGRKDLAVGKQRREMNAKDFSQLQNLDVRHRPQLRLDFSQRFPAQIPSRQLTFGDHLGLGPATLIAEFPHLWPDHVHFTPSFFHKNLTLTFKIDTTVLLGERNDKERRRGSFRRPDGCRSGLDQFSPPKSTIPPLQRGKEGR